MPPPDLAELFDRLRTVVVEVLRVVQTCPGPEYAPTVGAVEAALDALSTTVEAFRRRPVAPSPALSALVHALRNTVTVMAARGEMLPCLEDATKRRRAREEIEETARLVERLLASPPV